MKPIPTNAQIQNLIASHPHGVKGPPLAVAWSTHRPDTLVIIDTLGHKLIFPGMSLRGSEATAAISPTAPKEAPNKPGENQLPTTNKTAATGQQSPNKREPGSPTSPNKKEPGSPKPTNKPKP